MMLKEEAHETNVAKAAKRQSGKAAKRQSGKAAKRQSGKAAKLTTALLLVGAFVCVRVSECEIYGRLGRGRCSHSIDERAHR